MSHHLDPSIAPTAMGYSSHTLKTRRDGMGQYPFLEQLCLFGDKSNFRKCGIFFIFF